MRKSKSRKTDQKNRAKAVKTYKKNLKDLKAEAKAKFQAWQEIAVELWTEARKQYIKKTDNE